VIIETGRRLIESDGIDDLTMQKVASAVGVRAPSLYKHVQSRGDLIRMVIEAVATDLARSLEEAVIGDDPGDDLVRLAKVFRDFARSNPESYSLIFAPIPEAWRPATSLLAEASGPVLRTTEALVDPEQALKAARLVTAWAHGFVSMELAGAFRLEGDLDDAFQFGIERLVAALG
jgi:AcrR family transcriptional regulator